MLQFVGLLIHLGVVIVFFPMSDMSDMSDIGTRDGIRPKAGFFLEIFGRRPIFFDKIYIQNAFEILENNHD